MWVANRARTSKLLDHARINFYGFEKLLFGDVLFAGVRDVNAAGPDEKGLAPGALKKRYVGGESDDGCG